MQKPSDYWKSEANQRANWFLDKTIGIALLGLFYPGVIIFYLAELFFFFFFLRHHCKNMAGFSLPCGPQLRHVSQWGLFIVDLWLGWHRIHRDKTWSLRKEGEKGIACSHANGKQIR